MNQIWDKIKIYYIYLRKYILLLLVLLFSITFLIVAFFFIVVVLNFCKAFTTLWDFYYEGTLRACYCDKVDFKYPMSFFKFQMLFPFITFEKLGEHSLQTIRRMYWFVVFFYNIPLYVIIVIIFSFLIYGIYYIYKKKK